MADLRPGSGHAVAAGQQTLLQKHSSFLIMPDAWHDTPKMAAIFVAATA